MARASTGQLTIVLRNHALSETAVADGRDPGPSHECTGEVCTMVRECDWLRSWRDTAVAQGL